MAVWVALAAGRNAWDKRYIGRPTAPPPPPPLSSVPNKPYEVSVDVKLDIPSSLMARQEAGLMACLLLNPTEFGVCVCVCVCMCVCVCVCVCARACLRVCDV